MSGFAVDEYSTDTVSDETDVIEQDAEDETEEVDVPQGEASGPKRSSARNTRTSSRARQPITRAGAARAIAKYIQLTEAREDLVAILAVSLGAPEDDLASLAATVVAGKSTPAISLVTDLADAAARSPHEATVHAMQLSREDAKQAWALLVAAGVVTGPIPAKDGAAAVALAQAVEQIGDDERAAFDQVSELAGR
ncbi:MULTISPECIES: hypothetical protein [unclassified Microbacterium]|uniref:hypothetical protein n=1 Tax=unclassified Microbacterium TaxID=2609290 RepID=UPI0010F9C6C1|nr:MULTISPECIES: hypothetical protein [unclassified Microbacterium]